MQLSAVHFKNGMRQFINHKMDTLDVSSQEVQLNILDFDDKLKRCYLCTENWFNKEHQWSMWYRDVNKYVRDGKCLAKREGLSPFEKTIPSEIFYFCLEEGRRKKEIGGDLFMSEEVNPLQRRILGARDKVFYKRIENASIQGVQFLTDLRRLSEVHGYG